METEKGRKDGWIEKEGMQRGRWKEGVEIKM